MASFSEDQVDLCLGELVQDMAEDSISAAEVQRQDHLFLKLASYLELWWLHADIQPLARLLQVGLRPAQCLTDQGRGKTVRKQMFLSMTVAQRHMPGRHLIGLQILLQMYHS